MNEDKASSDASPMNIATISAGFEKGDFLVREEQGNRVYFDFFEEVGSVRLVPNPSSAVPGRVLYGGDAMFADGRQVLWPVC